MKCCVTLLLIVSGSRHYSEMLFPFFSQVEHPPWFKSQSLFLKTLDGAFTGCSLPIAQICPRNIRQVTEFSSFHSQLREGAFLRLNDLMLKGFLAGKVCCSCLPIIFYSWHLRKMFFDEVEKSRQGGRNVILLISRALLIYLFGLLVSYLLFLPQCWCLGLFLIC